MRAGDLCYSVLAESYLFEPDYAAEEKQQREAEAAAALAGYG